MWHVSLIDYRFESLRVCAFACRCRMSRVSIYLNSNMYVHKQKRVYDVACEYMSCRMSRVSIYLNVCMCTCTNRRECMCMCMYTYRKEYTNKKETNKNESVLFVHIHSPLRS